MTLDAPRSASLLHVPSPLAMIDLFAGCGGLTSGFMSTGYYSPVAAVEHDLAAAATYAANFGEAHVHYGPIEEWVRRDVPPADVVVGGPPCQGFSNLGQRRSDDPRNELWHKYVDTLVAAQPRAFLIENVDRFGISDQFKALLRETTHGGRLQDYQLDQSIVKATDFGASQARRRFIVIGTHRDLEQIHIPTPPLEYVGNPRTVAHALDGLDPSIDPTKRDLPDSTISVLGHEVPGLFKSHDLHLTRFYSSLSRTRFRHIPSGGNRMDLPERLKTPGWRKHNTGSFDVMGRLSWRKPSVTIRTEFYKPEKGRYLHPDEDRAISHLEAARLQGFDDSFLWCGNKAAIARQIGNAVPVELASQLGAHIASSLS